MQDGQRNLETSNGGTLWVERNGQLKRLVNEIHQGRPLRSTVSAWALFYKPANSTIIKQGPSQVMVVVFKS